MIDTWWEQGLQEQYEALDRLEREEEAYNAKAEAVEQAIIDERKRVKAMLKEKYKGTDIDVDDVIYDEYPWLDLYALYNGTYDYFEEW